MRSFVHQFLIVKEEERINSFFSHKKLKNYSRRKVMVDTVSVDVLFRA